jgi:hypothetical protein
MDKKLLTGSRLSKSTQSLKLEPINRNLDGEGSKERRDPNAPALADKQVMPEAKMHKKELEECHEEKLHRIEIYDNERFRLDDVLRNLSHRVPKSKLDDKKFKKTSTTKGKHSEIEQDFITVDDLMDVLKFLYVDSQDAKE